MSKHSYQQSLKNLNTTIEQVGDSLPKYKENINEIQNHVLAIIEHPGEVPFIQHHNLLNSLKKNIEIFGAEHPSLTASVKNVINTLSNMGI